MVANLLIINILHNAGSQNERPAFCNWLRVNWHHATNDGSCILFRGVASHLELHLAGIQRFGTPGANIFAHLEWNQLDNNWFTVPGANTLAHLGGSTLAAAHFVGVVLSQMRKTRRTWSDIHLIIIGLLFQVRWHIHRCQRISKRIIDYGHINFNSLVAN